MFLIVSLLFFFLESVVYTSVKCLEKTLLGFGEWNGIELVILRSLLLRLVVPELQLLHHCCSTLDLVLVGLLPSSVHACV